MAKRAKFTILIILSTLIVGILIIIYGNILHRTYDSNNYNITQEYHNYVTTTYYVTKGYYRDNRIYLEMIPVEDITVDIKCANYNEAKSIIDNARVVDNYKCNKDKGDGKK